MKANWLIGVIVAALVMATQAGAQTSRTVLPIPLAPFEGVIHEDASNSTPDMVEPVRAPAGAPNV